MNRWLTVLAVVFVVAAPLAVGCERTPSDVENWRKAKRVEEKMTEWIQSSEEPMAVRVKALEILIEEGYPNQAKMAVEEVDEKTRTKLVNKATPAVEGLWKKGEFPKLDEKGAGEGGRVKIANKDAIDPKLDAKDAAYFLAPYASGEAKKSLQNILAEWISEDWEVRDQLGATTVGQAAAQAGDAGTKALTAWLEETYRPSYVAKKIKKEGTEETKKRAAEILRKRAEKQHPDLDKDLRGTVLTFDHEALVPYLKKAVKDDASPNPLVDGAMEAILRIEGSKATGYFAKLVETKSGLKRWVAAQRLLESRGKPAFLNVAMSLPLEMDTYPPVDKEDFKKDTQVFCNAFKSEMKELEVEDVSTELQRALENDRWPAQVLGLQCTRTFQAKELSDSIDALTSSRQKIPGWGESMTVGKLAKEVEKDLSDS